VGSALYAGLTDGHSEGIEVGVDGTVDGRSVGAEGAVDGAAEGLEGLAVGTEVGPVEGTFVGPGSDGVVDGLVEGLLVGVALVRSLENKLAQLPLSTQLSMTEILLLSSSSTSYLLETEH